MLWLCLAASFFAQPGEEWRWPMDLPRQVTSSFGEYRSGRFHAAIDLRTGPIGQKVYASGDGHVSRVRCSPYGYGKAVYLSLDSGHTIVYGHLDGFEGALAEYVRTAQHSQRSYTVDLYPERNQFRVAKGDLIARSGQTGVGVPHLHYEWRDSANRPIDPRLVGLDWPDATTPVLTQILIVGRTPDVLINGLPEPIIVTPQAVPNQPGQYTLPPVHTTGPIGVGVALYDPANGGANKLGVQTLQTRLNGTEQFRVYHSLLSYDYLNGGQVSYHPHFLGDGRFLLAYRWTGNRSESYNVSSSDGWIDVTTDGELAVDAIDFHGNSAHLTIPLKTGPVSPPDLGQAANSGWGTIDFESVGEWLLCTVDFTAAESEAPVLVAGARSIPMITRDGRHYAAGFAPSAGEDRVTLEVRHPRVATLPKDIAVVRGGSGVTATWGDVTVSVPAGGPYGTMYMQAYPLPEAPVAAPVSAYGATYVVWPSDAPIDGNVEVTIPLPEGIPNPAAARVYRLRGSYWAPQSSRISGDRIVATTGGFGAFMVMVDDQAPRISSVVPEAGTVAAVKRPPIKARISDVGSGIGDVTVTCGDQWLLMEYDPEEGTITWMADEDLPSGDQSIRFRITDSAGNPTEVTRAIQIP